MVHAGHPLLPASALNLVHELFNNLFPEVKYLFSYCEKQQDVVQKSFVLEQKTEQKTKSKLNH